MSSGPEIDSEQAALDAAAATDQASKTGTAARLRFILPVALFVALAVALGVQLLTGDPDKVPSALIDKPVPEFALPPLKGYDVGLASADLKGGEVSLVNVFASWCGPCRIEHPLLMALAEAGAVPLYGINYKDAPDDAAAWLERFGNPYAKMGADLDGRVGIDWGVYGVPETFVIDRRGRIVYKHIGVLTRDDLDETILPLLERLRG